jgi:hypothetical protein
VPPIKDLETKNFLACMKIRAPTLFNLRRTPVRRYAQIMRPPPLTPQPEWHHLPRLAPEHYQGFAAVLWTITLEPRATGWLDDQFHAHFRELSLYDEGQ